MLVSLSKDIIEPSSSPWASEYAVVQEKTGDFSICLDFRRLNTLTKKNSFPLPNIEECLETLACEAYFSKLDFASGYWQVPMAKNSREMTAFRTPNGLYQFKVMPFGLTNAPASFQKMINLLFTGLKGLSLQVYLDDVCVATSTWEEHLAILDEVFYVVRRANLKLKGEKCVFGTHEIIFLRSRGQESLGRARLLPTIRVQLCCDHSANREANSQERRVPLGA